MSKEELTPEFLNKMDVAFYSAIAYSAISASNKECRLATENCLRRMLIEVYGLTLDEANEMISKIQ